MNTPVAVSYLGTLVWSNLVLNNQLTINDVLMNVSQAKNIVKTPIAGRNGTVKEYINDGDFVINVQGRIVTPELNLYPADDVATLLEICKINETIPIASAFLNQMNITQVVIDDYALIETSGVRNYQAFTLTMTSDEPIEINLD